MKSHVWRPLYLVLLVVAVILLVRKVLVPADFGIGARGYMYGWHRAGSEKDWQRVALKYRGSDFCGGCHAREYRAKASSPHRNIACENCHGPAYGHPKDPRTLTIDRGRELCLRCHFRLPYPESARGRIRGINGATHHTELECVTCHWPHDPRRTGSHDHT